MCIGNPFPCGFPLYGQTATPLSRGVFQGDEAESIIDINSYHPHTSQAIPGASVNISPSAAQPDRSFEDRGDTCYTHLPLAHAVDYWFDGLGLSLQATPVENPSNSTIDHLRFQSSLKVIESFVSTTLVILCRIHFILLCMHCEGRLLIGFH
jgi:hypothetical protein